MQVAQTERTGILTGKPGSNLTAEESGLSRVAKWKAYSELSKPGITKMVVLTASAGYYLALESPLAYFQQLNHIFHFLFTVIGITAVSSGSCALNHWLERDLDARMKRTARRPIPSGKIQASEAFIFGLVLSAVGLIMLAFINFLTVSLALITLLGYVAVYTPMKRYSEYNTLVGAVPGALPAMGGWVAVSGEMTVGALLMFLILFCWQMPHFLSLSWMYRKDYAEPGFKMLAVRDQNGRLVARQILIYALLLLIPSLALAALNITGYVYAAGTTALCALMLYYALRHMRAISVPNARKVLMSSYLFLLGIILLMFIDKQ